VFECVQPAAAGAGDRCERGIEHPSPTARSERAGGALAPNSLIAADLDVSEMVDYELMRRTSMTAVQTSVELAATSTSELQATAG